LFIREIIVQYILNWYLFIFNVVEDIFGGIRPGTGPKREQCGPR
ncbi:unnamed protein product, partial [Rotaria magnacalcarata]